jgi:hypothetical protein
MHLWKYNITKINILMSDEIRYFWPNDDKLSSLRSSDMSDSSLTFRDIQNKKLKITIFYICVQYDQEWGVYKWEICRSRDEINIKINLGSSKARAYKNESFIHQNRKKKIKNILFFTPKNILFFTPRRF